MNSRDDTFRERADDTPWAYSVLDRAHIQRTCAELARRGPGDERLQHSLEWGFFTRTQWGEFDTALYELERCWGKSPAGSVPIGTGPRPAKVIQAIHVALSGATCGTCARAMRSSYSSLLSSHPGGSCFPGMGASWLRAKDREIFPSSGTWRPKW